MNNCCNPFETPAWVSDMIQSVINQKIICNEIQAGLLDCNGQVLSPATHMVRCEELSGLVDEAIKNGEIEIPGIESLEFDGERITLVDQAGASHQIDISELAYKSVSSFELLADGKLSITLKDGTKKEVGLKEYIGAQSRRDRVIEGHADQDLNIILTFGDEKQIEINLGDQFKALNDQQMEVLKEILELNKKSILEALKTAADRNAITTVSLDDKKNIIITTGDGEQHTLDTTELRKIDLGRDSPFEWDVDGALIFNPERIKWKVIKNISFKEDGLHLQLDNQCDELVISVDDFISVLSGRIKVSVCEQAIITGDGSKEKPLCIDIAKLIDLLTTDDKEMNKLIEKLIDAIARVSGPCTVNITKPAKGTRVVLKDTDDYYVLDGGILVLPPDTITVGRQFTVIQAGATQVVVEAHGVAAHAPYLGSLKTAGPNAAITIICTGKNEFRVFGQTENG